MKNDLKIKTTMHEFKEFIMRGNILDMAIGVVMGTAFNNIVKSLVNDIIMPAIGIIGGKTVSDWSFTVNGSVIMYGAFIQNIIDFLIIAASMFMVIKVMTAFSKLRKKQQDDTQEQQTEEPSKSDEVLLLEEIRDLLKK